MSPAQHGFSLTSLPIGLGLTTAAHVHLFNRCLAKTKEQRQHYQVHQQLREIEMIVQSLQDMANLTEIVELLNITLDKFPNHHSGKVRRRQKFKRADPHSVTTRKLTTAKERRSVDVTADVSLKGKEKATTQQPSNTGVENEEIANDTTISNAKPSEPTETAKTVEAEALVESPEAAIGSSKSKSRTRGEESTRLRRSKKHEPVIITTDDMEQWIEAYKKFRLTQEECMKKSFQQMNSVDFSFFKLRNNLATMIRYLTATASFPSVFSKYFPRLSSVISRIWTKAGQISPPSSTTIPWRWSSSSDSVSTTSSGDTLTQPVAYMFLPLVPTLFISALHFVAYAKTQFALNKIRKDIKDQVRFARRLSLLSAFLLVREKRLNWMVEEIKTFEKEHSASEEGEYSSRNGVPRPLVLVQNSHQRVVNLLTGGQNDRQRRDHHRRLPSIDPSMFSFGPDLENMDLDKFLHDPFERARILRMELEAMREELVVFGNVISKANKG
ncbi:hypothetical protein BG006_007580 [Podila minutissima]|uniref:Uncharacterized protein n=1 Tax=Podila minutissima TaxID=64525 RepID=A0A9P5SGW1_9FUNG|nr:hypothetical protein BG006_007580 [Podila minutissima]